ncbi:MAG: O-antigen ligase family protein [Patescibacteria group bacterium]|nr:O-antigen ligase family protein [Patescibacteria group bacterium]MDE2015224.1 O-antigen ligase family protein [Patescibacteria group bacterium]MDE2227030.1 O-antigen ligase family protein [Patescibacteria group bacterium]
MLLKLSKFFLYASVFCVLIVMTSAFFPFIGGKDYFFRLSVELALIFFVLWWAFEAANREVRGRFLEVVKTPIFIAVSFFVVAVMLSTIFAYDPHAAFWSNYERGEGAFQMLHYYVFFVLLAMFFKDRSSWRKLFGFSLIAAAGMVLYGLFANLGWANNFISPYQGGTVPLTWWGKLVEGRFEGSLGNPAYVAPYLLFAMFYAAYLWADGKFKNKLLAGVGYAALIATYLFFFVLSETRGAFIGLGVGVFAFLIYLAFSRAAWRKWLVPTFIVLAIAGGLLIHERNSVWLKKLPGGRLFDVALSDQTVQTRLWTWGSAIKGFEERPIFGWGLENFSNVFDKYFDPRHFVPGQNTETWFDRAHNIYFDYLVETGILGLVSYLGIYTAIFWQFFRKRSASESNASMSDSKHKQSVAGHGRSVMKNALLFSLLVAYLVQGLAIFDVLPMYINLFMVFAFSNYYLYGNEHHQ